MEVQKESLMPDQHSGYPYSRDWAYSAPVCNASQCLYNSGFGTCAVPSKVEIDSRGRCKGFEKSRSA